MAVLVLARGNPLEPVADGDPLSPKGQAEAEFHGHRFANPALLREALTHRSALQGSARRGKQAGQGSNERLEFIGDRVLGLLIAEWLAEHFPQEQEGQLGPRHAQLVSRPILAEIAATCGLPKILSVAPNEAKAGVATLATVLADALEAVIGALYLDGGLPAAKAFVRQAWQSVVEGQQAKPPKDSKTALQEWALARGLPLPIYMVENAQGPSHAPVFSVTVTVHGKTGAGAASSKREAQRNAAADLLQRLS